MGAHSVTPQASELIQSLRREGQSYRECARIVEERLSIRLSHVAIKRHVDSLAGKKRNQPEELAQRAARRAGEVLNAGLPAPEAPPRDVLGEIEALEREAEELQRLLGGVMPHRDRTALGAELRATFASIRKAREAEKAAFEAQDSDTAWTMAKLRRFDRMNNGLPAEASDAADADASQLPEATGTEGSD